MTCLGSPPLLEEINISLQEAGLSRRYLQDNGVYFLNSSHRPPILSYKKHLASRPPQNGYFEILVCRLLGEPAFWIKPYSLPQHLISRLIGLSWQADWAWTRQYPDLPDQGKWEEILWFQNTSPRVFHNMMQNCQELISESMPGEREVISGLQVSPWWVIPFWVENEVNRKWKKNKYINIWAFLLVTLNGAERWIEAWPGHLSFRNAEVSLSK